MTASDWHYRAVSWVLPPTGVLALRGRTAGAGAGEESSARRARILVRRGDAPPIGRIFVRWDAANGGSELAVQRAVDQLRRARSG